MPDASLVVLKIGGATCRDYAALRLVLDATGRLARRSRLLVVPGGGEFADQVRMAQVAQGFSDDAAHWMAILAMDQMAHLIADRLERASLVRDRAGIKAAHQSGRIPVLAPHDWIRAADALPHSWDVTSDSIAACIAGELGARELILLKPVDGPLGQLVDAAFAVLCPAGLQVRVATPATLEACLPA